ncbi:DUF4384 domain-containing protein [Runella sp.]|uniref:DUF4384 domain-containing protein n=1 Tax=Runella sp. TaxID=1960881 RepID=UPI0030173D4F
MRYFLIFCFFVVFAPTQAQTIHLLGFFDTDPEDIRLKGHQKTIEKLTNLKQNLEEIGGLSVELNILRYPNSTIQNIQQEVEKLPTGPNDVILCILGGHGYNDRNSKSPRIIFPDPNKQTNVLSEKSIDLQEFAQRVFQKPARLKIVIGESCNQPLSSTPPIPKKQNGRYVAPPLIKEAIQRYFQQTSGEIILWSSSPGQYSFNDSENGGYYTKHFFEVLNEHLSDRNYKNQTWELLIAQASTRTSDFVKSIDRGSQQPDKLLKGVRYEGNQLPPAITQDEMPSAHLGFSLAVKTNQGRENVTYAEGDTMRVYVNVSKPSYLRLIYTFSDGQNTLLLDQYFINEAQTKKFAKLEQNFVCYPPFGQEYLICFASDTAFAPIPPELLKKVGGFTFILGPIANVIKTIREDQKAKINKERGMKNTGANNPIAQEGLLEDKIPITTKAKE